MKVNKKISKLLTAVLSLMLVLSLGQVKVSASDLPDPAQKTSLTVHKYSTASESRTPGTGLALTPAEAAALGTPLKGAGFTLSKVMIAVDKDTTPTDALAGAVVVGTEQTTDTDGLTDWTNLDQGYYVLSETTTPAGYVGSPDTIITLPMGITSSGTGWNYDVHVYPKNVKDEPISKEVTSTESEYEVGKMVSWKIDAKLDGDFKDGATYGKFEIIDELDSRLDFVGSTEMTALGGTTSPVALDSPADYTETVVGQTVTWALTNAGIDKIDANDSKSISVSFSTAINRTALTGTNGTSTGSTTGISNGGTLNWENSNGTTGSSVIKDEDKPSIKLTGVAIKKVDSQDNSILLDGAQFKIAESKGDAEIGTYLKDDDGNDLIVTTGDDATTTATVEKGFGMFVGLKINGGADSKFYLVEVKAPTGYVLRQSVIEVIIPFQEKTITATVLNQKIGAPAIDEEKPTFALPTTGGIGTVLFTVIGLLLIVGAVIIFTKTKKKNVN